MQTTYEKNIASRTTCHYLKGLLIRWWKNLRYEHIRRVARRRGATIGECVVMPMSLAKRMNANVTIGNHVSIQTTDFSSFRKPIFIGDNVIIGNSVSLVIGTHNIDSVDWENCVKTPKLIIEDYVWICPHSIILPSVEVIGKGAVIGAGSVVHKDVSPMSVMSGNPARKIRERNLVHSDLVVESLLSGDYEAYRKARNNVYYK